MSKRSGKFYSRNEKEVMGKLGLKATKGSGSGWLEKEDGENEKVLGQLKSTDAASISVKLLDIQKLEYHALVSHKIPAFFIQFLNTEDILIVCRPGALPELAKYLETGEYSPPEVEEFISVGEEEKVVAKKVIKSSSKSRSQFWKEKGREWKR